MPAQVEPWVALSQPHTPLPPAWVTARGRKLCKEEWGVLLRRLEPLLDKCTDIKGTTRLNKCTAFMRGKGCPGLLAGQAEELVTGCLIAKNTSYLNVENGLGWVKFCPRGRSGRNTWSRGYFQVRENGPLPNTSAFYLHRLLCWMYRGPPQEASLETGHACGHKCCICPWHMGWVTRQENKQESWDRRRRRLA